MKMYPHTFSGQPAVQVEAELLAFIDILQKHNVRRYLEIGCARGDTFFEIMRHLPKGSFGVAVDMPEGDWGLNGSKAHLDKAVNVLLRDYEAHAIYGSSRDMDVISRVKALGPFDAIFIDGDHSLLGVSMDYTNYAPLGGIVGFHDIADPMKKNRGGEIIDVPLFWRNIKATSTRKSIEIVEPGSTMGIGVLL